MMELHYLFEPSNSIFKDNKIRAISTGGRSGIYMSREIWNIFMFITDKKKRSAFLSTMDSIDNPFTTKGSYWVSRYGNMGEISRKNP